MTRDEVILDELLNSSMPRVHDETTSQHARRKFCVRAGESDTSLRKRMDPCWRRRPRAATVAPPGSLDLDDGCLRFAVETLQTRQLSGADRDVVGEAWREPHFPSLRRPRANFHA